MRVKINKITLRFRIIGGAGIVGGAGGGGGGEVETLVYINSRGELE